MTGPGPDGGSRRLVRREVLALVAAGLATWEGFQPYPTTAAQVSVAAVLVAVVALAVVEGRRRQAVTSGAWLLGMASAPWRGRRRPSAYGGGVAVWVVLWLALAGWDVVGLVRASRRFPTVSRLAGDVTRHPGGRAVLFAGWLALGLYVALAGRVARSRPAPTGAEGAGAGTAGSGAAGAGAVGGPEEGRAAR